MSVDRFCVLVCAGIGILQLKYYEISRCFKSTSSGSAVADVTSLIKSVIPNGLVLSSLGKMGGGGTKTY